ncbi:MAG: alpha/beta hydrolase [Rhizobiaceae bacterium]|nr:alpha/beta hydrolase [Rhizobiaceae bacterium]
MTTDTVRAPPSYLDVGAGETHRRIAVRAFRGAEPTLVWLGGYRSDMLGTKAERLSALAEAERFGFCRFDYSGHGESSGTFEEGTISRWLDDARAVFDATVSGPAILVGSSMGAWIALRLVADLRRDGLGDRIAGLLLLAPAPDFTRRLVEPKLSDLQKRDLADKGFCTKPSAYSDQPTVYTRTLLEDGARNLVMDGLIETGCPVHIIQGMADPDVPYTHALDLVSSLPGDGVILTLIRDGDHRLSREEDLARIEQAARELAAVTNAV